VDGGRCAPDVAATVQFLALARSLGRARRSSFTRAIALGPSQPVRHVGLAFSLL
jgi:hypothetical protein